MSSRHSSEDIYGETLAVFEHTSHPNEPLTSPEVADALNCPRRTAYKRLQNLVDLGALRTKKVSASGRVWWRPSTLSTPDVASEFDRDAHQQLGAEQVTTSRYQRFVEQNRVGICIIQDGVVQYVNPTFTDILGYPTDEALGEPVLDFVAEDEREMVAEHVRQREHGEIDVIRYEGQGKHADGTAVDVEIHGDLIEYEGEPAILGTLVDMSERKERERQLAESERRYRTLTEHFPNGVVALFDHDLRYTLAAGSLTNEADFSPSDLEGQRVGETAVAARERLEAHCRAALSGDKRTFEFEWKGGVRHAWTLPVTDETGSVFAGMLMTQDITERKQRELELEDYRTAVENVRDGVYMTDADRKFTMVNDAYCELTGYAREKLLGTPFSQVVDDEEVSYSAELIQELRAGEREVATTEAYHYTPDGERIPVENRFTIRPSDDDGTFQGTTGVVRDITDRLEREQELREQRDRYHRLVETSSASIVIYTADGTIAYVNDAATERLAANAADDLLGEAAIEFVHPDDRHETVERIQHVIDEREAHAPTETKLIDANGQLKHAILTSTPIMHEGQPAAQVVINDITERKERERQLEQYERLVETVQDGVYAIDEDAQFATVNRAFCEMVGWEREELVGQHATIIHDDVITPIAEELVADVVTGEREVATLELDLHTKEGDRIPAETRLRPFPIDGGTGRCGVIRDITERKEREHQLEQYETIFETVQDGVYAVDAEGRFTMVNEAYAEMVDYDRETLHGEHVSLVVDETVVTTAEEVEKEMKRGEHDEPKVEADLQRSDGGTITAEATFSLLPGEDTHERIGVVRNITERKEQERQLEQQRQELAALNHLQGVALNVSDLVLEQSTRTEMEQGVCERLAASNIYDFAWIGHTSRDGRELTAHATAGADHLNDITVSLDENDPTRLGTIARAVTTQSVQLSRNICEDPAYEQWCEERDAQAHSVIAVPIAYEGRRYGVLNLYTERSSTIGETEQAIIRQLAEIVGHAITALERGKSLLADRMIEVEYCSTALAEPIIAKADNDLELSSDRAIPLGEDDYLHYYTIDGLTAEQCMELVDAFPSVTNAHILVADGDSVRIAVRITDDTLASLFARFDGRTKTIEITEDEFRTVGELPETANIREVTETVTEFCPDMRFAGQRYVTRQEVSPGEFRTVIEDSLTDRQRTVLEAACYAGFFEYPRESSGEDIADSLDISSSTFHQHLRKAQKKLLDGAFAPT